MSSFKLTQNPHMLSLGALFPGQYLSSPSHQHTACSTNTVSLVSQSGGDRLCYFTHFETIRATLFIHTTQVCIPAKWLKREGIVKFFSFKILNREQSEGYSKTTYPITPVLGSVHHHSENRSLFLQP